MHSKETTSDSDEDTPTTFYLSFERNAQIENLPSWQVSDRLENVDVDGKKMSHGERSIRLYRLWLTKALEHNEGPSMPRLSPRRVANYWIVTALMRGLGDLSGEKAETRCAVLVRTALLARGFYGDGAVLDGNMLAHRMRLVKADVPCADIVLIATLIVELADSGSSYTPEISDISFGRILAAVNENELEELAVRFASGPRSVRLQKPISQKGYAFLSIDPPTPRRCLRERSDVCAAEHSEDSIQNRLRFILGSSPNGVWRESE
jgi:hypothetical protein